MEKRRFIKEPIWGNIEIFPWEAKLLSQFLVNRLHQVIQTSCAYLVYPGLKYSRFVHSIGTMYVATQMFINLVANSEKEKLDELMKECHIIELDFPDTIQNENLSEIISQRVRCPKRFSLLLGTVRTAALLHDLGHLPYSHIFEHSLDRFINNSISDNLELLDKQLTHDEQVNLEALHIKLRDIFKPSGPDSSTDPIHEVLGQSLLQLLLRRAESTNEDFTPFLRSARRLWADKELPISKSLLSADIDADRIDFVHRDGAFSGLFNSSIDFDRLFAFYELAEDPEYSTVGTNFLKARPSIRAAAEAEKLLWERFLDYKYIMSHHKVHLFDELLERLIYLCIADGSLNSILNAITILATGSMDTLRAEQRLLSASKVVLSSLNDSWIDVKLREAYEKDSRQENQTLLRQMLFEGLSERRDLFISLFKQDEDYYGVFDFSMKETSDIALFVRGYKYLWERDLSTILDTPVVIGDLYGKLKIGIKNKTAAKFFGLTHLREFLVSKYQSSRPFNVWYYSNSGKKQEVKEREIIDFFKSRLVDLSLM